MNPAALDRLPPRPAERHADRVTPVRPPEADRRAFERCLEEQDEPEPRSDGTASGDAAAWARRPEAAQALSETPSTPPTERGDLAAAAPRAAALPGEAVACAPTASAAGDQAALAARLDAPLRAPGDVARFEVLGATANGGLSAVELRPLATGGVGVAVVAGAENASLLDRHVPQLQRRLGARAVAHLRVDERDDHRR